MYQLALFISFVSFASALVIDHSPFYKEAFKTANGNSWSTVKTYHPPRTQRVYNNYDTYAYPKYEFEYAVSDEKTGDQKHHHEERDGDRVRGGYSVVEADGSLREVQYDADDLHGFNAIVSKSVLNHGNNAISINGHTRHFLPFGNGVKINYFFPNKEHIYKDNANAVIDTVTETAQTSEEPEVEETEKDVNKPLEHPATVNVESPIVKMEAIEGPIVEMVHTPKVLPTMVMPTVGPIPEAETVEHAGIEPQIESKEQDGQHDSDVASSYYHSRVYYVGF